MSGQCENSFHLKVTPRSITSIILVVLALLILFLPGRAQAVVTYNDSFTYYKPGSEGGPNWRTDTIDWQVEKGAFVADGPDHTFAICRKTPRGRIQTIEATLTITASRGDNWNVAGIALYDDSGNFWHLALIESPAPTRSHSVELQESYHGSWLAATTPPTQLTPAFQGIRCNWKFNQTYRLRLDLTQDEIVGTVSNQNGTILAKYGYQLNGPAVKSGQAALVSSGFRSEFTHFRASVIEPLPPIKHSAPRFPPFDEPGFSRIHFRPTGYFRVAEEKGRWWMVTPTGQAFYAVGTDHVNYNDFYCEKLGYAPYHRNCVAKYGNQAVWAHTEAARLKRWGFNALGVDISPDMQDKGLPHCEFVSFGSGFAALHWLVPKGTWTGFPNVFSPLWPRYCEKVARQICYPLRNDPWVIGYFLDNELQWLGPTYQTNYALFNASMRKPAGNPAKIAAVHFLETRYRTLPEFNREWGTHFNQWNELLSDMQPLNPKTARAKADRIRFVDLVADRYFSVACAAIRHYDPHHLILGCRFAGFAPLGVVAAAGRYCDVVSVNYYGTVDLNKQRNVDMPKHFEQYYRECRRPMMITEWSFPALDSGLPCLHGAGQRVATQAERAQCFQIYQRALFRMPFMVGSDFFMWADEPAQGISISFPEDSNYGLVDVNDHPWELLTQAATQINAQVYSIHAGLTPRIEISIPSNGNQLIIRNSSGGRARFPVSLWCDGANRQFSASIGPHQKLIHFVSLSSRAGGHLVAADIANSVPLYERVNDRVHRAVYRSGFHTPHWSLVGRYFRIPLVVSNPSGKVLRQSVVTRMLASLTSRWGILVHRSSDPSSIPEMRLIDAETGEEVPFQVIGSGEDAEICFDSQPLNPYRCRTFLLYVSSSVRKRNSASSSADRSFHYDTGLLSLSHRSGSSDLLSSVTIGGLKLGKLIALMHEQLAQPLWVAADQLIGLKVYQGPVCFAADVTVAATQGGADTKTAITEGAGNGYAPLAVRPHRYTARYRIIAFPGQPWCTVRLLWVQNSDSQPWPLVSYYIYALSSIGGDDRNDKATVPAPNTVAWHNPIQRAYYGCYSPIGGDFKMDFWRDTSPGQAEHPDVRRDLDVTLKPGQRYSTIQPPVYLFGMVGASQKMRQLVERMNRWYGGQAAAFPVETSR